MGIDKFALASVCGNLVDVFVNSENIAFHNVSLRGAGFIPRLLMAFLSRKVVIPNSVLLRKSTTKAWRRRVLDLGLEEH